MTTTDTPQIHGGGTPEDCCTIRLEAQAVTDQTLGLLQWALKLLDGNPVAAELHRDLPAAVVDTDYRRRTSHLLDRVLSADTAVVDGREVVVLDPADHLPLSAVLEVLRNTIAPDHVVKEVANRIRETPADGGKPFRWLNPDGSVGFDLPELTRRIRNAWETTMDLDPAEGDPVVERTEISAQMITTDEWESVCTILDLLPTVYEQRDQARSMAMRLEEELALPRASGTAS